MNYKKILIPTVLIVLTILNINIVVNPRFPLIVPNKVLSYQIYFDLETGMIASVSRVASREKYSYMVFKQLFYLNSFYKFNNLK